MTSRAKSDYFERIRDDRVVYAHGEQVRRLPSTPVLVSPVSVTGRRERGAVDYRRSGGENVYDSAEAR